MVYTIVKLPNMLGTHLQGGAKHRLRRDECPRHVGSGRL
jgi:hypothetical protein